MKKILFRQKRSYSWGKSNEKTVKFLSLASCSIMALALSSNAVLAQDVKENTEIQLEEIIVTGQRREQSILDVPVSATVFSADKIDKENITDAKGYLAQTPNVSFQQGGRNGQREIIISIRGISDIKGSEKSKSNQCLCHLL